MIDVTIQIGNSDNKLSQQDWAAFVKIVDSLVNGFAEKVYFFGAPPNYAEWQNAAWVFSMDDDLKEKLKEKLTGRRKSYMQDAISWTEGNTIFI